MLSSITRSVISPIVGTPAESHLLLEILAYKSFAAEVHLLQGLLVRQAKPERGGWNQPETFR
jgi:hypothetical protein